MPGPYVMGIDFGTESVRVGIFTPEGNAVTFCFKSYDLNHPRLGWAEQGPNEWWEALGIAAHQAIEETQIGPDAIVVIGTEMTSCTVMALDEEFHPLRPAILWINLRATKQSSHISQSGDPALKYNGYDTVPADWFPCKALWRKENQPEICSKAKYLYECEDWLTYHPTGRCTSNIGTATERCYFDIKAGGLQDDFFLQIGLDDLLDKLPSEVLDLGVPVGGLTPEAAEHLGILAGTPVAEGSADCLVAQIGLGVVAPGKIALSTGSSDVMLRQSSVEFHTKGMSGAFPNKVIPGQYTGETGQNCPVGPS